MSIDEVREYLEQIPDLDDKIICKTKDLKRWKSNAGSITAQSSGERVQSSGVPDKIATAVVEYLDLEAEIKACVEQRKKIISVIEQLKGKKYRVIYGRYVLGLSFKEIAVDCRMGESWATTLHGRALVDLQRLLNGNENNQTAAN